MECITDLPVIVQGPRSSSLYCSNFCVCAAEAERQTGLFNTESRSSLLKLLLLLEENTNTLLHLTYLLEALCDLAAVTGLFSLLGALVYSASAILAFLLLPICPVLSCLRPEALCIFFPKAWSAAPTPRSQGPVLLVSDKHARPPGGLPYGDLLLLSNALLCFFISSHCDWCNVFTYCLSSPRGHRLHETETLFCSQGAEGGMTSNPQISSW